MDTMRDELQEVRESQTGLSEGEKYEISFFTKKVLYRLFEEQIIANPQLDVFIVALEYDSRIGYYQIMQWDCNVCSFLNIGESVIPEKLLGMIFESAKEQGIIPLPEQQVKRLGIIPEEKETEEPKKSKYIIPKKKKPEKEKPSWYFLLNLGDTPLTVPEDDDEGAKETQKETG